MTGRVQRHQRPSHLGLAAIFEGFNPASGAEQSGAVARNQIGAVARRQVVRVGVGHNRAVYRRPRIDIEASFGTVASAFYYYQH